MKTTRSNQPRPIRFPQETAPRLVCDACGKDGPVFTPFLSDSEKAVCPHCGHDHRQPRG